MSQHIDLKVSIKMYSFLSTIAHHLWNKEVFVLLNLIGN